MTPTEILTPVVLGLAFFGYVRCLASRPWLTLLLTLGLGAVVWQVYPLVPENALTWLCGGVLVIIAYIAARLWPNETPQTAAAEPRNKDLKEIVIDGTNVLYWDGNEPALWTLREVVDALTKRGYAPYVFLDASSRHHLKDKSLTPKAFAKALALKPSRVMVCPAGTEADTFILKFAKAEKLPIVSNDRFSDRAQQVKGIKLIKGVIANGKPIFEGF